MANQSSLFKPAVSGASLGKKKEEDGQFVNPPAYPEVSGFNGASDIGPHHNFPMQKTPSARKGKV